MLPEIGGHVSIWGTGMLFFSTVTACLFQVLQAPDLDPKLSLQSGSQKSYLPYKEVGSWWFKSQQIIFKAMRPIMVIQILLLNSYQISPLGIIKNNLCVWSFATPQLWWYSYFFFIVKT